MKPKIPQIPAILIRRLCKEPFQEYILGDLEEQFLENVETKGYRKARRLYYWQGLKFLRPGLLKSPKSQKLNSHIMFKTNLKIAFRLFKKNKTYTAINVLGLASALAISMLIIQYVRFELSYESHNPNAPEIVRITMDYMDGDVVFEQDCETYPPLGPKIKDEFSNVNEYARTYHIDELSLKVGDLYFRESKMYAADASFFKMFNYPFVRGNQEDAFKAPNEVVLTQSQAHKFYGTDDVIGQVVEVPADSSLFKVIGIISDPPANTHLKFGMLLSYPTLKSFYGETDDNWNGNNTYTYLQLSNPEQYGSFLERLRGFNEELREQDFIGSEQVASQPIEDIHLYSHKSFEAEINGSANAVYFMLGVAILIILIAMFNYINLSTSKALDRANEVGIRKVNGSSRGQLVTQFYTESILMYLFAGIAGLMMMALSLNYFRQLANLPSDWHLMDDPQFWIVLGSVLILSILLSGSIPASVLSSFQPAQVLKGKFTHSVSGSRLRQVLVILQFGITIFLLIQTLAVSEQLNFMRNKDLGIDSKNVIVVNAPDEDNIQNLEAFKGELLNRSMFENVAFSEATPGMAAHQMSTTSGINPVDALEKHNNNMYLYWIDHEFLNVMDMELMAGQNFNRTGNKNKVIVNEEALRIWGIPDAKSAIGKQLGFWGEHRTILGVVKDFHQFSPKDPLIPMVFVPGEGKLSFLCIRTVGGLPIQQVKELEEVYTSHFPNAPFDFFFLDQEFDKQYQQDVQFQQVFSLLSVLAIIIACLGLFGLASFTITKRSKEIGVRKVLGASISQLIILVSSQFLKLVMVAIIIALPISYWLIHRWLTNFTFQVDLSIWAFILPAALIVLVAFLSILGKTYGVSIANPTQSLRDE